MPVNQIQFRSFVLDGLRAIGAVPEEVAHEIYQATLPPDAQRIFANQKQLLFTFQRDAQADNPDAELVTIGGNLLNHLIDVLRKRAQAATVMLISRAPTPPALFACPVPAPGCTAVGTAVIASYTPLTQFLIKATYLTDEKIEQIFEVTVDQATGKVEIGGSTVETLLTRPLKQGRPTEALLAQIDEAKALRLALDAVQPLVQERARAIEASISRHLDEELARIRAFYAASAPAQQHAGPSTAASDTLSDEEAAQQKAEQERQEQDRQEQEAEQERKIEMARERYRLIVRTSVLTGITLFRPLHRYTFRVSSDQATSAPANALPLTVDVDPLSGAIQRPVCGTCGSAMTQICYCERTPHLVCQTCAQVCTSCKRGRCVEHALGACAVDGAGVCETCLTESEECGHRSCPDHQMRCSVSQRTVCTTCARLCASCGRPTCPTHTLACHIDQTPLCVNCAQRCARCNEVTCAKDQVRCRSCDAVSCTSCASRCADPQCRRYHCNIHLQPCATPGCTGRFCPTCSKACAQCGRAHCPAHTTTCHECGQSVGAGCAVACASHGHPLCRKHALPCNVCNRLACPTGLTSCSSCGRATCTSDTLICAIDKQPFCPSCAGRCATCNAVHCVSSHLIACQECGRKNCPTHAIVCHIDGRFFCEQHQATCAVCGQHHCQQHTTRCALCEQPICSTCKSPKGVCRLCASLHSTPANDPRILQAHLSMAAAGVRPKSVSDWLLAETAARRIIVARTLWREHLFVIRPLDGVPLAHKRFGLLQHSPFPDQTP
jgi:hypothetical protein